jgi:cation diffusion facilitator CzcD-associated flavoprotein CzcO
VPERTGPDGKRVLDVLVVGAGMCGQTAGWNLLREGIRNIRVIDRNPHGQEGPWNTMARMPILRSPKHLTGPDLGVPSLTFRAWYEAQHGAEGGTNSTRCCGSLDGLPLGAKVVDLPSRTKSG